jgi:trehalose 6-phosphate synthase/phosphatase
MDKRETSLERIPPGPGRLWIVSNRLPVNVEVQGEEVLLRPSAGGLATGLSSVCREREAQWIGWPGSVPARKKAEVRERLVQDHACHPIFLPVSLAERFYEGYSNRTLWPLFHSFPMTTRYAGGDWEAYQEANQRFCDRVLQVIGPNDQVWVHDYQLMLLPKLLRERRPDLAIGFFLHIPFPSYHILRLLPQHRAILEGLLAADLVGFHTYSYMEAFLSSTLRVFGCDSSLGQIVVDGRTVQAGVFPMGIDFARFAEAAGSTAVQDEVGRVRERLAGRKLVFSVSRLDYTKGIPEHLEGIDYFFQNFPEWREQLVFILSVVPSREKVERYAQLKREIDEIVGRINSRYASLDWMPIWYMYRNLAFDEMVALYAAADVGLVLPLRDGMNLVAKEYLASKLDDKGMLVLSETAGAAKELQQALIANPNSREEVAGAIAAALTMPEEEQITRTGAMRAWLKDHDVANWAGRFLAQLDDAVTVRSSLSTKELRSRTRDLLATRYAHSACRLLLLDYDGTLAPFAARPQDAAPPPRVLEVLARLGDDPKTNVTILSGRDRNSLERWLGCLPVTLVAEHGAWAKESPGRPWKATTSEDSGWKDRIRPILETFKDWVPGSLIEEKTLSLAWHYRNAEASIGTMAAKELVDALSNLLSNSGIEVLQGNRVVEVKSASVTKGAFYLKFLAQGRWDFVLGIGDDWTDETLFRALPDTAYSIKVGPAPTAARFSVPSQAAVLELLERLAAEETVQQHPLFYELEVS